MPPPPKAYCHLIQVIHKSSASKRRAAITNTTPSAVIWNTAKDSREITAAKAAKPPTSQSIETGIQFP